MVDAPSLLSRVDAGDIDGQELVIGGTFTGTDTARVLKDKGAEIFPGVRKGCCRSGGEIEGLNGC